MSANKQDKVMENSETWPIQQELWQENSHVSSMAKIIQKLKQNIAKLSLPKFN